LTKNKNKKSQINLIYCGGRGGWQTNQKITKRRKLEGELMMGAHISSFHFTTKFYQNCYQHNQLSPLIFFVYLLSFEKNFGKF
jgi:hypothetical protein